MTEKMHVTTTENLIGWVWAIGAGFPTGTDWSAPILEIIGAGCRAVTYEAYGKKKKERPRSPPRLPPPAASHCRLMAAALRRRCHRHRCAELHPGSRSSPSNHHQNTTSLQNPRRYCPCRLRPAIIAVLAAVVARHHLHRLRRRVPHLGHLLALVIHRWSPLLPVEVSFFPVAGLRPLFPATLCLPFPV